MDDLSTPAHHFLRLTPGRPAGTVGRAMYLSWRDAEGQERSVVLTREWTRIGRSLVADVRLDDPEVARRHALVVRAPDGFRLLDDSSLSGTWVNGRRVDRHTLRDGDEIQVGGHVLEVHAGVPAVRPQP
jgi:pSer/pThr/pTyr-binding forkhead associated (FHA) protein